MQKQGLTPWLGATIRFIPSITNVLGLETKTMHFVYLPTSIVTCRWRLVLSEQQIISGENNNCLRQERGAGGNWEAQPSSHMDRRIRTNSCIAIMRRLFSLPVPGTSRSANAHPSTTLDYQ